MECWLLLLRKGTYMKCWSLILSNIFLQKILLKTNGLFSINSIIFSGKEIPDDVMSSTLSCITTVCRHQNKKYFKHIQPQFDSVAWKQYFSICQVICSDTSHFFPINYLKLGFNFRTTAAWINTIMWKKYCLEDESLPFYFLIEIIIHFNSSLISHS